MKQISLYLLLFFVGQSSFAQELTPQVLQKIKTEVEILIPAFKAELSKQDFTPDQIEFSADTFRIQQIFSKKMDIVSTTYHMVITTEEMTSSYDKLLNKYYNKLYKILSPEDKNILVSAQKAWLAYRDSQAKLIGTLAKEEYSGGGTIQWIISKDLYSDIVIQRTIQLFNNFNDVALK